MSYGALELQRLAAEAKTAFEEEKKRNYEADKMRALTHFRWVHQKYMEPAAKKGHVSISGFSLGEAYDLNAFREVCADHGYVCKGPISSLRISWGDEPKMKDYEKYGLHGGAYGPDE